MSFGDQAHQDIQGGLIVGAPMIMGLVILAAMFYLIAGAVVFAFFGLLATPVIQLLTRLLRWSDPVPFGEAFGAAFYGIIAFAVLTVGSAWVVIVSADSGWLQWVPIVRDHYLVATPRVLTPEEVFDLWRGSWVVCVPGILGCAAVLAARIGGPYSGALGYVQAIIVSTVAVVCAAMASYWLAVNAVDVGQRLSTGEMSLPLVETGIIVAFAILLYSIPGALVAGLLLMFATSVFAWRRPGPFREAYGVASLGTLIYLAITAVTLLVMQPSGEMFRQLYDVVASEAPLTHIQTNAETLLPVLKLLAWAQVPALLVGALVLVMQMGAPFSGAFGYLKACVASVFVFTLCSAVTLMVATHLIVAK